MRARKLAEFLKSDTQSIVYTMTSGNNQKRAEIARYLSIMDIVDEARAQIAKEKRR
jgi:hypothetical protein